MFREKAITPEEAVKAIREGPSGPGIIAAFSFDRVLVGGLSGSMLMRERVKRKEVTFDEILDTAGVAFKSVSKLIQANEAVARSVARWAGKTDKQMEELGSEIYIDQIQDNVFPEIRQIIGAHRQAGHTLVVATSASRYQVEPTVEALGIEHLLCTEVEVVEGKLTGKLLGEAPVGLDKARALERFVEERGGALAQTHFYADGGNDLGMMAAVGYPHPVNPDKQLTAAARRHGWRVLRFDSRGAAKVANVARSIAGLASILPILQVGLATGVLRKDKRKSANLIMPAWIGAQLAVAGVKLRVTGARNLARRRPAVFVFNHRNNFDASFVASLVKSDYVTVAKAEMARNPIGKLIAAIAPTVFIDREGGDPDKTAATLQQIVDAIEQGYSIIIAPEGTRVRGNPNSVGRFKMGAFHIAMTAGVPIVPVVIRNALDVASRDGPMRPGVVDVAVLPPMDVDDADPRKLAARTKQVRQMFIDTLNDWPNSS